MSESHFLSCDAKHIYMNLSTNSVAQDQTARMCKAETELHNSHDNWRAISLWRTTYVDIMLDLQHQQRRVLHLLLVLFTADYTTYLLREWMSNWFPRLASFITLVFLFPLTVGIKFSLCRIYKYIFNQYHSVSSSSSSNGIQHKFDLIISACVSSLDKGYSNEWKKGQIWISPRTEVRAWFMCFSGVKHSYLWVA